MSYFYFIFPPKAHARAPTGLNVDVVMTPFPKLKRPLNQMVYEKASPKRKIPGSRERTTCPDRRRAAWRFPANEAVAVQEHGSRAALLCVFRFLLLLFC